MNYQELYKILTSCYAVAPKKDIRYYLNSVHIKANEGGYTIEVTDGHKLVQFKSDNLIQGIVTEIDVILDITYVKLFIDKIKAMQYHKTDLHDVVITSVESGCINFNIGGIAIIDGRYPDCERVIWKDFPKPVGEIGFDARLLADILKVTKPFNSNPCQPVKMEFKDTMASARIKFDTNIESLSAVMILVPCRI